MEEKHQNVHIKLLSKLKIAIIEGDVDKLKILNNSIAVNKCDVEKCLENEKNPFRRTNAVILACKEKRVKVLQYLLSSQSRIIENSSGIILPTYEDETNHNAFYYAIRSGDSELIEMLMSRWPGNYFNTHHQELEQIISAAYEELKLNNVHLSNAVKFLIEKHLIDLRFNVVNSQRSNNVDDFIRITKERLTIVIENVKFLREKFSIAEIIDEECLYVMKFVVQNINVLKQKLKSTYDRLPWEEVEFCLTIFISSHYRKQEINLYCNAFLEDHKILSHLENFVKKLETEIENLKALSIGNLTAPIKQKRSIIVADIINSCPEFESLYDDYQNIRDIYSLEKISEILKLGLGADIKEREGKIVIARMLQVLGEYMKNTLESPKMSDCTNELLLAALPKNTRKVILRLRDSISHIDSVFKRTEIENNKEDTFFYGILTDLKGIGIVVDDILEVRKSNIISSLNNKIHTAETFDDFEKVKKIFKDNVCIDSLKDDFNYLVNNRIKDLVDELSKIVPDQTDYEKQLFQQINNECSSLESYLFDTNLENSIFKSFLQTCGTYEFNVSNFRDIKESKLCKQNLKLTQTSESFNTNKIADLVISIYKSVEARSVETYVNDVRRIMWHVLGMLANVNLKSIQELEYKLIEEELPRTSSKTANTFTRENYRKELSNKQKELECILNKNLTSHQHLFECFEVYKKDKQMQAAVEMLVLDIMSIVAALKMNVGMDFLFVDDICPVLVGKCLRNHLAHNNELVTLLLDDPDRVIFLNALKLSMEGVIENKKKRLVSVGENISSLKKRHDSCLKTLKKKREMFDACAKENIDDLKSSIQKGADVKSRCREGHGVLHFASKGGSISVLQFLLDLDKDLSLSAKELEVASSNGKRSIIEFIVEKIGVPASGVRKSSLLHIAAKNGHKDVVEFLIENKSDPKKYDFQGLPIHYAAQYNHKNIVEVLLKSGGNTIDDRNVGGFSLLHIAADFGYIELVEYLLEVGADVNAKTDKDNATPLHLAAIHGHLEVVKMLVSKGANVNARILNGFPPLYFAADNNFLKVVSFLLENGANVNAAAIMCKYTPLHTACEKGFKDIVKVLLEKGADVNLCNTNGLTPIYLTVAGGHKDILTILLAYGSDIHAKTKENDTLLHYVAKCGQTEIANKLINNKLEINARNMGNVTPLHVAAYNGHADMVDLLINNGASVDLQDLKGDTSLHLAVLNNHKEVIEKLIKRGVKLDVKNYSGVSPLCVAIMENHEDVISLLIEHGAAIIDKECNNSYFVPLKIAIIKGNLNIIKLIVSNCNAEHKYLWSDAIYLAVEFERFEIIELLITSGVDVNISRDGLKLLKRAVSKNNSKIVQLLLENGALGNDKSIDQLLFEAVKLRHADMVDILLKNYATVDKLFHNGRPLLHEAVTSGYIKIFKSIIAKCENVNVTSHEGSTALHVAALLGHKEIVEVLLDKGANVNVESDDGTPLHLAAGFNDDPKIVELLLSRGADVNIEDKKKRTPLQLAVARNKFETVKTFLDRSSKKYINFKGSGEGLTLLNIAAQRGNMELVRYLIDQGADIDIKNVYGSKPIHHAAREGYTEIVKFFLSKGSCLNETGYDKRTLLHYATLKGHIKVVKYLIAENANLNAKTTSGLTPLHFCVLLGFKEVARLLLDNGAMYNVADKRNKKPVDMVEEQRFYFSQEFFQGVKCDNISSAAREQNEIVALLRSTDNLFKALKRNDLSEVTKSIKGDAVLNAKDIKDNMALHYVSWKGYTQIAEVLLNFKANVNASIKDGSTPLHYSAKFSHLDIVKVLLSNGAIYNSMNDSKSTPLDLATDKTIKDLLKIIDDLFKYVRKGSKRALTEMGKIKDSDILKAVVNARNENNKTLLMVGKLCDYPKIKELTNILIEDMSTCLDTAYQLSIYEKYEEALKIYRFLLEQIKVKLGPNNLVLLDVKEKIGGVLYKQNKYSEALDMLTEVYNQQKEFLGSDSIDVMETRSTIALILHRLAKNDESLEIYNDIYEKQKKLLKPDNQQLLNTQLHMALVLHHLGRFEDALKLNKENYEVCKKTKGEKNLITLCARNNIAMVLNAMGKHNEAIELYEEVYKMRTKTLGPYHSDTLRPLHNIAAVHMTKARYEDAIKRYEQVFEIQKKAFGLQHRDTMNTQFSLGKALYMHGKTIASLKTLKEYMKNAKPILGDTHPDILVAQSLTDSINIILKMDDSKDILARLDDMQRNLNTAASKGAERIVIDLINNGVNVNYVDEDGRGALYYAVYSGHLKIVKILLENSANVFQVTNKGNTLFHAAASKGHEEIFEFLLQRAEREKHIKVIEIINTRTATSGSTPLHVAAKNGSYENVKSLLNRGAIFDMTNNEGLIPSEVSQNQDIIRLLAFVQDIFNNALNGNGKHIIMKLKSGHPNEVKAAIKARNFLCITLLQAVLSNCERKVALHLVDLLKDEETMNKRRV